MLYVVSYDAADNVRRRRLAALLADHGRRVLESVFECRLQPADLPDLLRRARLCLHPSEDSLRVYPLCRACAARVQTAGVLRADARPLPDPLIL